MTGSGTEPWPEADLENDLAGFRASGGGATARFAAAQAAIIRSLVSQVAELVGGEDVPAGPDPSAGAGPGAASDDQAALLELAAQLGVADATELPDDPILARLLPDAYADDPQASGEFRRYTEIGLRSGKVAAAQTVLDTLPASGGRVRLSEADARAWLRALNDVRLSLGVVLGVTDDFEDTVGELTADDPRAAYIGVYQWLAYLQESLVDALE
ncbi:MAG TPA: DUF2017 domain-containing protein [Streptosporangiaceae bacterium]|nr:DUF2017 domain-containing protein [Streptosporangiaceae bacterium]